MAQQCRFTFFNAQPLLTAERRVDPSSSSTSTSVVAGTAIAAATAPVAAGATTTVPTTSAASASKSANEPSSTIPLTSATIETSNNGSATGRAPQKPAFMAVVAAIKSAAAAEKEAKVSV